MPYAEFYNALVEECEQFKWASNGASEDASGVAAYHTGADPSGYDYDYDYNYYPPNPYDPYGQWHPCADGDHAPGCLCIVPPVSYDNYAAETRDCYNCGMPGHLSRDCPDLGKKVMGQPVPYHPAWGRGRKGAKGGGAPQRPYKGRGKGKGAKGAAAKGKGWAHYTAVYDPYAWDWGDGQWEQHQLHFAQDAQPQGLAAFSQDDLRDEIRRRQAAALIQESIAAPAPPQLQAPAATPLPHRIGPH